MLHPFLNKTASAAGTFFEYRQLNNLIMKAVLIYTTKIAIVILLFVAVIPVHAQDKNTIAGISSKGTDIKNFIFTARTATPQSGSFIQLNSPYDFRVSGDTVISYLPYYGRAYTAPLNTSDAGFTFTTTDFTYKTEAKNKGKQETIIEAKVPGDTYKFYFTFYEDGNAQLQVASNNRQSISFAGNVRFGNAK